jgi:hypothetical protein
LKKYQDAVRGQPMNPPKYNPGYTWTPNIPRVIPNRLIFATVVRDATAICTDSNDTFYPVSYNFDGCVLVGFRIMSQWCESEGKYGYWIESKFDNGAVVEPSFMSDIWTAKINFCLYLGLTEREINDIFFNGKSRFDVQCAGCPCNGVEKKGVRNAVGKD